MRKLVAALALVAAGCGAQHTTSSPSLPLLHIGGASAAPALGAPASANGIWQLAGPLPTGPSSAPVFRNARPTSLPELARALAAYFGLTDSVRQVSGTWLAGHGQQLLSVSASRWSFGNPCNLPESDFTNPNPNEVVSCATAGSGGVAVACLHGLPCPTPPPVVPWRPDLSSARQLLQLLGLSASRIHVDPGPPSATLHAHPVVGGKATTGLETTLTIARNGHVTGGNGSLARWVRGPAYPIISARAAFDLLVKQPVPLPMIACPVIQGRPNPCTPRTRVVTGAQLGLMWDSADQLLVPVWLFSVRGWDDPAVQIAVEPRYVSPPIYRSPGYPPRPIEVSPPASAAPGSPAKP